jgi:glucose-6-phosphate dehydrogenase assembly protein OpcA
MAAPVTYGTDPRRIEAEIARLRERETSGFGGGVKANLFNLVVACLPGSRPDEALDALLGRRPARIIRLAPGRPAGPVVSGRCFPGTLERSVCLEEIDIAAGDDPLGSGAGAWTPLLARDIPTLVWLSGSWTAANLPTEAAAHTDKLIVDSSGTDDPAASFAALHRLREAARGRLAVADLAWSRTLPLRGQAARAFDPPAARDALTGLTGVRLEGGTRAEALLFFLWFASRLGWRVADARGSVSLTDAGGRAVSVVHADPAPLVRGARVAFTARGTELEVTCSANGCASVREDRGPWRVAPDGELLLAEVDTLKQDALLDTVLGMTGRCAGDLRP